MGPEAKRLGFVEIDSEKQRERGWSVLNSWLTDVNGVSTKVRIFLDLLVYLWDTNIFDYCWNWFFNEFWELVRLQAYVEYAYRYAWDDLRLRKFFLADDVKTKIWHIDFLLLEIKSCVKRIEELFNSYGQNIEKLVDNEEYKKLVAIVTKINNRIHKTIISKPYPVLSVDQQLPDEVCDWVVYHCTWSKLVK